MLGLLVSIPLLFAQDRARPHPHPRPGATTA